MGGMNDPAERREAAQGLLNLMDEHEQTDIGEDLCAAQGLFDALTKARESGYQSGVADALHIVRTEGVEETLKYRERFLALVGAMSIFPRG